MEGWAWLAASQGTMNNFTFGNQHYQYYERRRRLGRRPGVDGADVVQTHMTNSRLTDPEVLEWRFPVCSRASRSPRIGRQGTLARRPRRGAAHPFSRADDRGDPLRAVAWCVRTVWREAEPGMPGALRGPSRRQGDDSGRSTRPRMAAGDVFVIETPGGGGYGPAA